MANDEIYGLKNDELRPDAPAPSAEAKAAKPTDNEEYTETAEERAARKAEEAKLPKMLLWERKLLDFSLRNALLNLRVRGKVVPLASVGIDKLEDALQGGSDFQLGAMEAKDMKAEDETGMYDSSKLSNEQQAAVAEGISKGKIFSYTRESDLATALKGLYRAARNALEENGANTLYLVLGALRWHETEKSAKPRYAPILLLPVEIVKKPGNHYVLRHRDEDMILNTTLVEFMRQQYDIDLSELNELPMDDAGVDVKAVLDKVRALVAEKPRWGVCEEAVIGLFSFSKFVMWNDIHANGDKMRQNPIIESLITNQMKLDVQAEGVNASDVDREHEPKDFATPVDADSSQLEAVVESGEGKSFILHGPPGTGKSQTITNMIANAVYHGKRVLFVAEKMAALSVVQKRLNKIGIGDFCLEMHSNKATKTHFLSQMEKALEVAHYAESGEFERKSAELFAQRQSLLQYMQALHQRMAEGWSTYECIVGSLAIDGGEMDVPEALMQQVNKDSLREMAKKLTEADGVFRSTGHPAEHPLKELRLTDTSITAGEKLKTTLQQVQQSAQRLLSAQPAITGGALLQYAELNSEVEKKWFLPKIFARKKMAKTLAESGNTVKWNDDARAVADFLKACGGDGTDQLTISGLCDRMDTWLANTSAAHDWSLWCTKRAELEAAGLGSAVDYLLQAKATGEQTANALQKSVLRKLALRGIDADPKLQRFNGLMLEQVIEKYREMAKEFQALTKQAVFMKLAARIPNVTLEASNNSEMSILKRSIKSKGRGKTIRQLIDSIPTLLPRLCPIMLMSPLSVAQYLRLDDEKFDLVMFDEASQMPTSEAVGAIARGKALVVVGDPMQMPPTSFFATTNVGEEDIEYDDMESILDDCLALSIPSRYLTWHYRSKHESLIAFSNANYYGGRLNTFPSVDDRASKVSLVHVDGVYDMGKTRCNRAEAEAIVKEVVRRLSDDELSKRSIGIVSFSKVQQELIEDLLVKELAQNAELEKRAYDVEEPIFVKNLENVQGDERDVILFSVGYGPDKDGKVSMNFGPLNNTGGERRLNVAVSRSCYEMVIFSSLAPEQIDLKRTDAEGVKGLKAFLEFARSGRNVTVDSQKSPISSEKSASLVDVIAARLEAKGYDVDTHIGRSNFKIDLAVADPANPQNYLLAIMTDGKNYFETKTERDREIGQPGVLKMLGWNVMRVWSVDWFLDPDGVMQRIEQTLQEIQHPELKQPKEAAATAAQPKQEAPKPAAPQPAKLAEPTVVQTAYVAAPLNPAKTAFTIDEVEGQAKRVKAQIDKIIATEQPITLKLLVKRIAKLWGVRSTPRLQQFVVNCLGNNYVDALMKKENPYLWTDFEASKDYKQFRTESDRAIDEIPLIEIINAILYAVEQQVAVPLDDLKSLTAKILGFSRQGDKIVSSVERALVILVKAQKIDIDKEKKIVKLHED